MNLPPPSPAAPSTPSAAHELLDFKGHLISVIRFDDVPFFHLGDLCEALRRNDLAQSVVHRPNFPDHAKRLVEEEVDGEVREVLFLSPVGVWLFTALIDPYAGQGLAAWAKKAAGRMCPNPRQGDPAMFLSLMPDGDLPPRPAKFSGRRSEWLDLKDTHAHWPIVRRAQRMQEQRAIQARLLQEAQAAHDARTEGR